MPEQQGTKARPDTLRTERIGGVFIKLKRWADGAHSIEISAGSKEEGYKNINFGVYEATGIADALMSLTTTARKEPAHGGKTPF